MKRALKYIIVSVCGFETPIIFDSIITHIDVSIYAKNAISAGFCEIWSEIKDDLPQIKVCCYGESESIGVKSRNEIDANIIESLLIKTTEQFR